MPSRLSVLPLALAGLILVPLLAGCSGEQEDPRITLCRGLAADVTHSSRDQWQAAGNRFVRPEYAAVSVEGTGKATCFYKYEAVEEGAMEQATPLLAYATLPYKVEVDGKDYTGQALTRLVTARQIAGAKAAAQQAQQHIEKAADQVKQGLEKAGQEIQGVIDAHSGN